MAATVKYRDRRMSVEAGTSVREVVEMLGLSLEGVITKVGDSLVTEDYRLRDGDLLEIIPAISGG
ncbi:MAG: MoaD/ThiS family protein [Euryarchaeota archaeon]|nr:MoaD/ThiS family protein [Euryarchaeota archaeon]